MSDAPDSFERKPYTPLCDIPERPWWCVRCAGAATADTDRSLAMCKGCERRDAEWRQQARSDKGLHEQAAPKRRRYT